MHAARNQSKVKDMHHSGRCQTVLSSLQRVLVKLCLIYTAILDTNTTKHASEIELYIIVAILDNFGNGTLNHEMSLSQAKLVQCSLAIVGFSSDKINILQHIKHLFITIALAPRAPDGMNPVMKYLQRWGSRRQSIGDMTKSHSVYM